MRFFLIIVLGLCLPSKLLAQRAFSSQVYHLSNLELAKIAIVQQDYETAYQIYEAHFQLDMPAFAEDHYNALLLAVERGNWSLVLKTGRELRKSGFCMEQLKKILDDLADPSRSSELLTYFDQIPQEYDDILQTQISLLLQAERMMRRSGTKEQITAHAQENYQAFLSLIDQFGFPSERSSGLFCTNDLPNFKSLPLDNLLVYFAHEKISGLEDLLNEAFKAGNLPLNAFLHYRNILRVTPGLMPSPLYEVENEYYLSKLKEGQLEAFNENREIYGFPTVETQLAAIKAYLIEKPMIGNHQFALGRLVDVVSMDGFSDNIIEQYFVVHKLN